MSEAPPPSIEDLLISSRGRLQRLIQKKAGTPLLRFESVEDLTQGIHLEALRSSDSFHYQGEGAFFSWLSTLAGRFLQARREHWFALKRQGGQMLRLSQAEAIAGLEILDPTRGPKTLAERREEMVTVVKALSFLRERDALLVRWASEGASLEEIARHLDASTTAAEKARSRALERFRQSYALLVQYRLQRPD